MRSTSRAEHEQETTETLRDEQRAIDGQRTGTARPFPLWRLPSGPYSPPIDSTFGSGIPPGPNTGHLTFDSVVRFQPQWQPSVILPGSVARLLHTARSKAGNTTVNIPHVFGRRKKRCWGGA